MLKVQNMIDTKVVLLQWFINSWDEKSDDTSTCADKSATSLHRNIK